MIEHEPPYGELLELLRKNWQIDASWDGLRKFWYIGWTDEHMAQCKERARGLGAFVDSLCDPLNAENEKLLELAIMLHGCAMHSASCEKCRENNDGYACDYIMQELGIEAGQ